MNLRLSVRIVICRYGNKLMPDSLKMRRLAHEYVFPCCTNAEAVDAITALSILKTNMLL
jgi:hypothetical protein